MRFIYRILITVVLLLSPVITPADKVTLNNGGYLIGFIEEQDENEITLRTDAGRMILPRSMIRTIEISARGATHLQLGQSFHQSGQLDQAEAEFELALAEPESYDQARNWLERIRSERALLRTEEIQEAMEHAQDLVAEEQFEEAIAFLSELLDSKYSDSEQLHRQRGEILLQQAEAAINHLRYAQAKELLVAAHEDQGSSVRLHTLLGIIDKREGRLAQAREEFRLARREALAINIVEEDIEVELAETEALLEDHVPPPWVQSRRPPESNVVVQPLEIWGIIERAGKEFKVDPLLVEAVIHSESSFQVDAVSPAGAQGLMQLMPGTASDMGVSDPFDPEQNIRGGTRYLSLMLAEFKGDLKKALAAYNAGPHKVRIYGGIPPYRETRAFVPKVLSRYDHLRRNGSELYPTG